MKFTISFLTITIIAQCAGSIVASPTTIFNRRQSSSNNGFTDPRNNGGSILTRLDASSQLGEPLNVIISDQSDKDVLTSSGLSEYFESLYFSPGSCAGISLGGSQQANLGDGTGYMNQTDVLRFNYYSGDSGTCLESVKGGNHLRYWIQNGSSANTNAVFIAASVEMPAQQNHMIVNNGYDLGRDQLTGNATNSTGTTSPGGYKYTTTMQQVNLLQNVQTSQINHGISIDGNVNVLTVKITKTGQLGAGRNGNSASTSGQGSTSGALSTYPGILSALSTSVLLSAAFFLTM